MNDLAKSLTAQGEVVSIISTYYTRKDGSQIVGIWIAGAKFPFVDWSHKILTLPKVRDQVRIVYHEWAPKHLKGVAFHHVIDRFEITSNAGSQTFDFQVTMSVSQNDRS